MPRVTIVTSKGTERVPAKQAVSRIEAGNATLDESDVRGCRAMAAHLALRRRPLLVPEETKKAKKVAAPPKKTAAKNGAGKKKGSKKSTTRTR